MQNRHQLVIETLHVNRRQLHPVASRRVRDLQTKSRSAKCRSTHPPTHIIHVQRGPYSDLVEIVTGQQIEIFDEGLTNGLRDALGDLRDVDGVLVLGILLAILQYEDLRPPDQVVATAARVVLPAVHADRWHAAQRSTIDHGFHPENVPLIIGRL